MAIIGMIPKSAVPAERVQALAKSMGECRAGFLKGNLKGTDATLYTRLSAMMCWDAAIYCAWTAKGVECKEMNMTSVKFDIVKEDGFGRLFPAPLKQVNSADELRKLPEGCFVGFVSGSKIRHAMLHVGQGQGAGNKNNCIFSGANDVGWELVDMTTFFGKDAGYNGNGTTKMVYAPVTGQTI